MVTVTATAVMLVLTFFQGLYLIVRCLAVDENSPLKGKVLACQRMVEVNLHLCIINTQHTGKEPLSIPVPEGKDRILVDMLGIKGAILDEVVLVKVVDHIRMICSVCLFLWNRELIVVTILIVCNILLEPIDGHSELCVELQRIVSLCLLNELQSVTVVNE